MNRVKIVATIGPSTNHPNALRAMVEAGMDIVRLNGSHADLDWHARAIALVRKVIPDMPVLFDIPGRKIRTAKLNHKLAFSPNEQVVLTTEDGYDGRAKVSVTYPDLHTDLAPGDLILADDSNLCLTVTEIVGRDVICRAQNAGTLQSAKGIHVPGVNLRTKFLSDRDRRLIHFAREKGVEFIGMSFVESAADVEAVRALSGKDGPRIVSKIETHGALERLDEVIGLSDALMIDRGDLSVETNLESVALFQKRILAKARPAACSVIVATEMLHSMTKNPFPTKAEVSDISNAVLDGADALMLSGETAVGKFPVEAVALMRRIADTVSRHQQELLDQGRDDSAASVPQAIGDAIALICRRLKVTKIVAITLSGYAAHRIAAKMPRQPILAVSNDPVAVRRFNLLWGTKGVHVDIAFSRTGVEHVPRCLEALWRQGELVDDDLILVTAVGYPKSGNHMNLIEMHKVADLRETLGWVR